MMASRGRQKYLCTFFVCQWWTHGVIPYPCKEHGEIKIRAHDFRTFLGNDHRGRLSACQYLNVGTSPWVMKSNPPLRDGRPAVPGCSSTKVGAAALNGSTTVAAGHHFTTLHSRFIRHRRRICTCHYHWLTDDGRKLTQDNQSQLVPRGYCSWPG